MAVIMPVAVKDGSIRYSAHRCRKRERHLIQQESQNRAIERFKNAYRTELALNW